MTFVMRKDMSTLILGDGLVYYFFTANKEESITVTISSHSQRLVDSNLHIFVHFGSAVICQGAFLLFEALQGILLLPLV